MNGATDRRRWAGTREDTCGPAPLRRLSGWAALAPALGLGLWPAAAEAGGFTITDGEVVTVPQYLLAPGDIGTVESGGTIDGSVAAIGSVMSDVKVINAGTVRVTDTTVEQVVANAIQLNGDNSTVVNSGLIAASTPLATTWVGGVAAVGTGSTLTNSGAITVASSGSLNSYALAVSMGEEARVASSGTITATARGDLSFASGINVFDNSRVINSGTITTQASGFLSAASALGTGANSYVVNTGEMSSIAAGDNAVALTIQSAFVSNIDNQGTIISRADGDNALANAISAETFSVISNSGFISATANGTYGFAAGIKTQTVPIPGDPGSEVSNAGIIQVRANGDSAYAGGIFGYIGNRDSNSGLIDVRVTGSHARSYGITVLVDGRIENSGRIISMASGEAARANGLFIAKDITVVNSGQIDTRASGTDAVAEALYTNQDGGALTNTGRLSATATGDGAVAYGIHVEDDYSTDFTVTNTGVIAATGRGAGTEAYGLMMQNGAMVTNCGTIAGSTAAVTFNGSGSTLNLCADSHIEGALQLGTGNALNVELPSRTNLALHYEGTPTVSVSGGRYAMSEGTIATFDPTGFSGQDEMLNDLTRVIADGVDQRLAAARLDRPAGAVAMNEALVVPTADAPAGARGEAVFWATALGQTRDESAQGPYSGYDTTLGGLMLGLDGAPAAGLRAGAFIGAATAGLDTNTGSQTIDANSYFAGVYAGLQKGAPFLNLAVTAGLSDQSSNRSIEDNLASGGRDHAKASYDGWFISPAATLGADIALPGAVLTPSIRARYAGLSLDGYDESGSSTNLSVGSRTVQLFDLRGQLAFAVPVALEGGTLDLTTRLGADATFASDNDVDTQLLGQSLDFTVANGDTLEGFAGLDVAFTTRGGTRLFAAAEVGIQDDGFATAEADAGFELPF